MNARLQDSTASITRVGVSSYSLEQERRRSYLSGDSGMGGILRHGRIDHLLHALLFLFT